MADRDDMWQDSHMQPIPTMMFSRDELLKILVSSQNDITGQAGMGAVSSHDGPTEESNLTVADDIDVEEIYEVLGGDILQSGLLNDIDLYLECDEDALYVMPYEDVKEDLQMLTGMHCDTIRLSINVKALRQEKHKYTCDGCGQQFRKPTLLKDHKATHHGAVDLHQCTFCPFRGKYYRYLQKHMQRQHSQAIQSILRILKIHSRNIVELLDFPSDIVLNNLKSNIHCVQSMSSFESDVISDAPCLKSQVSTESILNTCEVTPDSPVGPTIEMASSGEKCDNTEQTRIWQLENDCMDITGCEPGIGTESDETSRNVGLVPSSPTACLQVAPGLQCPLPVNATMVSSCLQPAPMATNEDGDYIASQKSAHEAPGHWPDGQCPGASCDENFEVDTDNDTNPDQPNHSDSTGDLDLLQGGYPQSKRIYSCSDCSAKFKQKRSFEYHLKKHAGIYSFKCEICDKKFPGKDNLRRHAAVHRQQDSFVCPEAGCGRICKMMSHLREHAKRVHGAKTFECDHEGCGKAFAVARELKAHLQIHSKLYKCSWTGCERSFRDKFNLKTHYQVHTGEKMLACKICDYKCIQKASLNWHMKSKHPTVAQQQHEPHPSVPQ